VPLYPIRVVPCKQVIRLTPESMQVWEKRHRLVSALILAWSSRSMNHPGWWMTICNILFKATIRDKGNDGKNSWGRPWLVSAFNGDVKWSCWTTTKTWLMLNGNDRPYPSHCLAGLRWELLLSFILYRFTSVPPPVERDMFIFLTTSTFVRTFCWCSTFSSLCVSSLKRLST